MWSSFSKNTDLLHDATDFLEHILLLCHWNSAVCFSNLEYQQTQAGHRRKISPIWTLITSQISATLPGQSQSQQVIIASFFFFFRERPPISSSLISLLVAVESEGERSGRDFETLWSDQEKISGRTGCPSLHIPEDQYSLWFRIDEFVVISTKGKSRIATVIRS